MDTYKNKVRVAAHRGNSKYFPENTILGFKEALKLNVDQLEIDLHMTKDGEIIMMHDHKVDRTTNGTGLVRDLTLAQLKELDASYGMEAYRGAKIPTLGEVFDLIQNTRHIVNVEVKTDEWFYPQIEEKCLALAREKGVEDRIIYSSFNHYTLLKLRQLKPDAKLGMLFGDIMLKPWEYAAQLDVDYLHPMKMNIYVPDFSAGAAKAGCGVNMWTINDPETMQLCLNTGAGIITNYPDVAIALKNK